MHFLSLLQHIEHFCFKLSFQNLNRLFTVFLLLLLLYSSFTLYYFKPLLKLLLKLFILLQTSFIAFNSSFRRKLIFFLLHFFSWIYIFILCTIIYNFQMILNFSFPCLAQLMQQHLNHHCFHYVSKHTHTHRCNYTISY